MSAYLGRYVACWSADGAPASIRAVPGHGHDVAALGIRVQVEGDQRVRLDVAVPRRPVPRVDQDLAVLPQEPDRRGVRLSVRIHGRQPADALGREALEGASALRGRWVERGRHQDSLFGRAVRSRRSTSSPSSISIRGDEPVALVERARAPLPQAATDPQDVGPGTGPDIRDERVQDRRAVALPLVALIDHQPPHVVRPDQVRIRCESVCGDAVADHREADRRVAVERGPHPRAGLRVIDGVLE